MTASLVALKSSGADPSRRRNANWGWNRHDWRLGWHVAGLRVASTRASLATITAILLDPQLFPLLIHQRFGLFVHQDFVRPWAHKTFGLPFARGIDTHLGAEIRQARSMVERIDRPERELDIALR